MSLRLVPGGARPAGRWLLVSGVLAAVAAQAHADRPAPGTYYEEGVELYSYPSEGGRFIVWYVTEGEDAVWPVDVAPADGIPDFVAEVAAVAEESHDFFVNELGFRPPLIDAEHLPAEQVGGDERFDFYLWNFSVADGSYEVDGCMRHPNWCVGYVLMENDFVGFSYPSVEIAIRVLVSHEYFHAIQAAYDSRQDVKWSEGTAVWAEEKAYPEQDDYERLLRHFLARPHRPFDRRTGAALGDGYPYGAALWPTYLDERYGQDIIREIWEGLDASDGEDRNFLTVTDELLQAAYGSDLVEAWLEFTQWNLFTGTRADPSRAYKHGADWEHVALEQAPEVSAAGLFSLDQQAEGMSARYTPVPLPDLGGDTRRLSIVTHANAPAVGTAYLWQDGALSEAIPLAVDPDDPMRAYVDLEWSGQPLLYVVVTSVTRGAPMRTVTIAMSEPPPAEVPVDGGKGGCSVAAGGAGGHGAGGHGAGLAALAALGLLGLAVRRRRA